MARRRFRLYRRKDRAGWWGDIVQPNGRRKRMFLGRTKVIAEHTARDIELRLAKGKPIGSRGEDHETFKGFALGDYTTAKQHMRSWNESEERRVRRLIRHFGDTPIASIDRVAVDKFKEARRKDKNRLGQPLNNATVNRDLARLKNLLYVAEDGGVIPRNPMRRYPIGGNRGLPERPRFRFLHPHEYKTLRVYLPLPVRRVADVAVNTGMRRGELLNLTWPEVDLLARRIWVGLDKDARGRPIPLNRAAIRALREAHRKMRQGRVFLWDTGKPIEDFRGAWHRACREAGFKDLHFHDLRHTAITWFLASGSSPRDVMEIVGHKTLVMILRYSHVVNQMKDSAVDQLEDFYLKRARVRTEQKHSSKRRRLAE